VTSRPRARATGSGLHIDPWRYEAASLMPLDLRRARRPEAHRARHPGVSAGRDRREVRAARSRRGRRRTST
jgi:hypothetical protein